MVDGSWQIAAGGGLAHPGVPGKRPPWVRMIDAYLRGLHAAATHDSTLGDAFLRVAGLVEPPRALLRPDRALRVPRSTLRRDRGRRGAAAASAPSEEVTPWPRSRMTSRPLSVPSSTAPARSGAFERFACAAAIATALVGLGYALAFIVLGDPLPAAVFLLLGGLLATPTLMAVYYRLRRSHPG